MRIYTIGFTKKKARTFFDLLTQSGADGLVDVRLNNVSQLAGFAKRDDLAYFLEALCGMAYVHEPSLAPTKEMLDAYKKDGRPWEWYEEQFMALMSSRQVEVDLEPATLDNKVLLCSEPTAHHCHRRLVAEYLSRSWPNLEAEHIE